MSFPTLETPRLRLRELTLDDAPALLAIHGDGPAMRHFGTDPLTTLAEAEDLVRRFAAWRQQPHPGVRWGLERRVRVTRAEAEIERQNLEALSLAMQRPGSREAPISEGNVTVVPSSRPVQKPKGEEKAK